MTDETDTATLPAPSIESATPSVVPIDDAFIAAMDAAKTADAASISAAADAAADAHQISGFHVAPMADPLHLQPLLPGTIHSADPAAAPRLTALYDPEGLRALVARIEAGQHHAVRQQLVDELTAEGLLRVTREELADGSERLTATLCGLEVTSSAGIGLALAVWCNKVRRVLAADVPAAPADSAAA